MLAILAIETDERSLHQSAELRETGHSGRHGSAASAAAGTGTGGGALLADVGRLFGRLYPGGGAAGGAGDALGDPVLDPVRDPGPEPGGGGGFARSVPALTCSLRLDFNPPNEPEPGRLLVCGGVPGDGKPGGDGKPAPGPVGGVTPSCPVPEN